MWAPLKTTAARQQQEQQEEQDEESEEARLYALRSAYNKTLAMMHGSKVVGDEAWEEAKEALVKLKDDLSSTQRASSSSGLTQECKRLQFLANKNLARLLSQECGNDDGAYLASLAASFIMEDIGGSGSADAGSLIRTAKLALKVGDVWSCQLLLSFHDADFGELFRQAKAQLHQLLSKENNPFSVINTDNCWISSVEWLPIGHGPRAIETSLLGNIAPNMFSRSPAPHTFGTVLRNLASHVANSTVLNMNEVATSILAVMADNGPPMTLVTAVEEIVATSSDSISINSITKAASGVEISQTALARETEEGPNHTETSTATIDVANDEKVTSESEVTMQNRRSSRQPVRKMRDDEDYYTYMPPLAHIASVDIDIPAKPLSFFENAISILFPGRAASLNIRQVASSSPEKLLSQLCQSESNTRPQIRAMVSGTQDGSDEELCPFLEVMVSSVHADHFFMAFLRFSAKMVTKMSKELIEEEDLTLLPLAILKSWRALLRVRNSAFQHVFNSLNDGEKMLLCECSVEVLRNVHQYGGLCAEEASAISETAEFTLNNSLYNWQGCLTLNLSGTDEEDALSIRRLWLFLTHSVVGSGKLDDEQSCDVASVLAGIKEFITASGPLYLLHVRGDWGAIDLKNLNLLTAFLQDTFCFGELEKSHSYKSEWLKEVRDTLEDSEDLMGMVMMSMKRWQYPEDSFLVLIFRTCQMTEDLASWSFFAVKVFRTFPSLLLMRNCSEDDSVLAWCARAISVIGDTIPELCDSLDAYTEMDCSQLALVLTKLILSSYTQLRSDIFAASAAMLTALVPKIVKPADTALSVQCCMALVDDISSSRTEPRPLFLGTVSQFLADLVAVGALSAAHHTDAALSTMCESCIIYANVFGSSKSASLAGRTAVLVCSLRLTQRLSVTEKMDSLSLYINEITREDLVCDGGVLLLKYISVVLQKVVNNSAVQAGHFGLEELTAKQQFDFCTLLGQVYFLLYEIAFVPVPPAVRSLSLPITGLEVDDIFRFYSLCVDSGRCVGKAERRTCLMSLVQAECLATAPYGHPSFRLLSDFLLGETEGRTDANSLIGRFLGELASFSGESLQSQSTIYYDLLCLYRDGYLISTRDKESCNLIASDLPSNEWKLCLMIDLAVKDLVYSPQRFDSWLILQTKLIEYLQLICDDIGGMVVTEHLPPELLESSVALSLTDLVSGVFRFDLGRGKAFKEACDTSLHFQGSEGQGGVSDLTFKAWGLKEAFQVEKLFLLLDLRRNLIGAIRRVNRVLRTNRSSETAPLKERAQMLISFALNELTLSFEHSEDSLKTRECKSSALAAFQEAVLLDLVEACLKDLQRVYLRVQIAKLRWELFCDVPAVVESLNCIAAVVEKDTSKTLWRTMRRHLLNDLGLIALDVAFLYLSLAPEDLDESAIATVSGLVKAMSFFGRMQSKISQSSSKSEEHSSFFDTLCELVLCCLVNFRESQRFDQYNDFRSVVGVVSVVWRLYCLHGKVWPDWFLTGLQSLQVESLTPMVAFAELNKLFEKKKSQIVAMWVPEKPTDEWDCQLKRTYEFDYYRRTIFNLFTTLAVAIREVKAPFSVLYSCYTSRHQSATVRLMLDRTVLCIATIISEHPNEFKSQMVSCYEILYTMHTRLSSQTCKKLQKALCVLYTKTIKCQGHGTHSLKHVLGYCHTTWGVPVGSATPAFHKRGVKRKVEAPPTEMDIVL